MRGTLQAAFGGVKVTAAYTARTIGEDTGDSLASHLCASALGLAARSDFVGTAQEDERRVSAGNFFGIVTSKQRSFRYT